jgi:hypothetical protein
MIRATISSREHAVALREIASYISTPEAASRVPDLWRIRAKLEAIPLADGQARISLTNREANALMDALAESDDDVEDLSEKLTGRLG